MQTLKLRENKWNLFICFSIFILYMINTYYIKGRVHWIFDFYFNDIMAGILIVAYTNIALSFAQKKFKKIQYILLFVFACGIFWEVIFPHFFDFSTPDIFDMAAYLLGGTIYWMISKKFGL